METSYTIQMASKISGVGVHTIRAWEKRYKALEPNRDSSGHRVYTKTDVEKLILLSELCLLGYSISKVAYHSIEELKALLADLGQATESSNPSAFNLTKEKIQVDLEQSRTILLFALRAMKLDVINQELGKIKQAVTAREFAIDILLPIVNALGELKSKSLLSDVQEMAIHGLIHFHSGYFLYKVSEIQADLVMVAHLENESHDLFPMMAGLLGHFHQYALNVSLQHSNVETILETLKIVEPKILILSAFPFQKSVSLPHFEACLEKISSKFNGEILVLGTLALNREKFPVRKFLSASTLYEIDQFLLQRKSQKL